jgi:hypothetical protein
MDLQICIFFVTILLCNTLCFCSKSRLRLLSSEQQNSSDQYDPNESLTSALQVAGVKTGVVGNPFSLLDFALTNMKRHRSGTGTR